MICTETVLSQVYNCLIFQRIILNYETGFLRSLEYYDGILFLTTNRVGQFDDAFTSRIHHKFQYPDFTDEDRKTIWKSFMEKLEKERGTSIRLAIDAKEYLANSKEMEQVKWNGREIRNGKLSLILAGCYLARFRLMNIHLRFSNSSGSSRVRCGEGCGRHNSH